MEHHFIDSINHNALRKSATTSLAEDKPSEMNLNQKERIMQ